MTAGKPGPSTPAACDGTVLPVAEQNVPSNSLAAPLVTPSVPVSSLEVATQHLKLSADPSSVAPGQNVVLSATASASVTDTSAAIEIFDETAGTVVAACMQASRCIVAYSAPSGTHTFGAFITTPTSSLPIFGPTTASNLTTVSWIGVTLASDETVVAPGGPITFTATSTIDVGRSAFVLDLYDTTTKKRLTYCSSGSSCATVITHSVGGVHSIVAYAAGAPDTVPANAQARSRPVSATWLGITLNAGTTYPWAGGIVYLRAVANVDLTNTPWSMGIADQQGLLVGRPCKVGNTCSAQLTLTTGHTPMFTAVIGALPPMDVSSPISRLLNTVAGPTSLVDIQARSKTVQPERILWGVDSCKSFTDGMRRDGQSLMVHRALGDPDFWGRYLTNSWCPGLSSTEIAAAASWHMGILPIYSNYDCSAVSGYATALGYAAAATTAAEALGIPPGVGISVDIEPPGAACPGAANVDAGFIEGWYDGITFAGYVPVYYGNGTSGSEFGNAWCAAVSQRPETATYSFLWSFEPSLIARRSRVSAPAYAPYQPACAATVAAWQYTLSSGSNPDVDTDEALSTLPVWFP
jgi:hypothetical protein